MVSKRDEPGPSPGKTARARAPGKEGEIAATWERIDSLVGWEANPRKDQPVEEVAAAIEAFGFGPPVTVRVETRELIAGHTRVAAARSLGWATVPARLLDVTEDEAHQMAIADNKLGELAKWDKRALGEELAGWSDQGLSLELLGFSDKEARRLMGDYEVIVKDVPVSEIVAEFYLSASGRLPAQAEFLDRLRKALCDVPGVQVTISVTGP